MASVVAALLAISMFPSLTALSVRLYEAFPVLGRYFGPINPLKFFFPLVLVYIWQQRKRIPQRVLYGLIAAGATLALGSLTGGLACGFPPEIVREGAVLVLGVTGALALMLFPGHTLKRVILAWVVIVYASVVLNLVWPSALNWINSFFFDPERQVPLQGIGAIGQFLMGFFDVVSLGKLFAWLPWLAFWAYFLERDETQIKPYVSWFFYAWVVLSLGLILATTQRGPLLGMTVGALAFLVHRGWRASDFRMLKVGAALFVAGILLVPVIVPKQIIQDRVVRFFAPAQPGEVVPSKVSAQQRTLLWKLAARNIIEHPLGRRCIPKDVFLKEGLIEPTHTHSLILEQFASRGWLWGLFHLAAWCYAFWLAWRGRKMKDSALFGGIVTTLGLGLVDHPWFVINHALILGTFLLGGLRDKFASPPGKWESS